MESYPACIPFQRRGLPSPNNTVLSNIHSRKIELVRSQWSDNAPGIIKGIGMVNCMYFNPLAAQF